VRPARHLPRVGGLKRARRSLARQRLIGTGVLHQTLIRFGQRIATLADAAAELEAQTTASR
jgi:hypothetical protein